MGALTVLKLHLAPGVVKFLARRHVVTVGWLLVPLVFHLLLLVLLVLVVLVVVADVVVDLVVDGLRDHLLGFHGLVFVPLLILHCYGTNVPLIWLIWVRQWLITQI